MASDLNVIIKAKELATHTLRITSNANRYPKKFRYKNFALFTGKGVHRTTYKYPELAQMIQPPPEGCVVISEKQAKDAEWME